MMASSKSSVYGPTPLAYTISFLSELLALAVLDEPQPVNDAIDNAVTSDTAVSFFATFDNFFIFFFLQFLDIYFFLALTARLLPRL